MRKPLASITAIANHIPQISNTPFPNMSITKNPTVSHGKTMGRKMGNCSGLEGGQSMKPTHNMTEAPMHAEQRTALVALLLAEGRSTG